MTLIGAALVFAAALWTLENWQVVGWFVRTFVAPILHQSPT
jgi:hypothetical protein